MARKYGIKVVPTFIFIRKDGSIASRIEGSTSLKAIEKNLYNIWK